MSAEPDVLLATIGGQSGGDPSWDQESPLLVAALARRGLRAEIAAWDAPIAWARSPLVVVRSPWDYTDRHEQFLAWVRAIAARTTLVNDAGLIAWNMHKRYLVELARAGVPVVPTSLVEVGASLADQDAARGAHGDRVVIKPAISAGARGTILVSAASAPAAEHLARLTRDGDALVQPYLPQVEAGEVSLVCFGGVLSHAVRKLPAPGDFRVQGMHGGSVVEHEPTAAERAVAQTVLDALPRGASYARIDLVTAGGGPLLMEAELIEPELFLGAHPQAAQRFADVLRRRIAGVDVTDGRG